MFTTSDMQFGFKGHISTTKCTFALTETVNYFRKNKSNVYVMLLDATKAFDKVNYVKLFYQLIDRGLNPVRQPFLLEGQMGCQEIDSGPHVHCISLP